MKLKCEICHSGDFYTTTIDEHGDVIAGYCQDCEHWTEKKDKKGVANQKQ